MSKAKIERFIQVRKITQNIWVPWRRWFETAVLPEYPINSIKDLSIYAKLLNEMSPINAFDACE
ncbi:hypothetical protein RGQ30_20060 [Limnobacter thiooxidans]|uniref:Uncharacterized protein n=1 Tax=Limnobacter thiooxidans TaxID=131080 RepID=A0AA86J8G1_9BURK|nr:hypothetical protein RGQ30_20060 [Limnobacter thiooxidans]